MSSGNGSRRATEADDVDAPLPVQEGGDTSPSVLIVSPNKEVTRGLADGVSRHGFQVFGADELDAAVSWAHHQTFVSVVVDTSDPLVYPPETVRRLRRIDSGIAVVFIVPGPSPEIVEDLKRLPGTDLIRAPVDADELALRIHRLREVRLLAREADHLRGERKLIYRTDGIIAQSDKMRTVLELVNRVASQQSNVLLVGETGTGKELIAGALHYSGPRRNRAFVKVNCAALPETLLASELFGHEKGAYTGANRQRIGRFEQADGGTILLDEIGDISLEMQTKLLRAVQFREFERVGGDRAVSVDIRVIAATNRDLRAEVRARRFREDLYYRLAVIVINVPPLRERSEDILPIAEHLLDRALRNNGSPPKRFSAGACDALVHHSWAGNVRELENAVERSIIMADGEEITPADLGLKELRLPGLSSGSRGGDRRSGDSRSGDSRSGEPDPQSREGSLERVARETILDALERCDWVQKDAAEILGISARALNYRIRQAGITHDRWHRNRGGTH